MPLVETGLMNSNGRHRSGSATPKRNAVVVAVKASKEIPRAALTWALTNVVRPGDSVRLLVVIPAQNTSNSKMLLGRRLWGFSNFHSDCADGYLRFMTGTKFEQKEYIAELCNQTMCQLHDIYDPNKVTVKLKVMNESKDGAVASEAKRVQTNWVILERQMKREIQHCMEQLDCNIIVVKNSEPKVLRWNFMEPRKMETEMLPSSKSLRKQAAKTLNILDIMKVPHVTPTSSPDRSPDRTSSISSLDFLASPSFMSDINLEPKVKQMLALPFEGHDFGESDTDSDSDYPSTLSSSLCLSSPEEGSRTLGERLKRSGSKVLTKDMNLNLSKNVRDVMSFNESASPHSPPLCSICQNKTPCFGKPPRLFSYAELEEATGGFLEDNFLAEGGYGSVHRGVLRDGLVIAVKQHKLASSQGDREFCSEVQVLSCAQHRNVVMLIGYCAEDSRRLLVYEYICNGSLDSHLYGRNQTPLDWAARQKIAVGAARGLRYLHEECRVGCIVHRDLRPNNILLTHDFEPLVGDFGLARFQPDGDAGVETRVIGTFGYLAPEYAQSGQVSEKADIYAFGVVLLELITGRKAVDINRPKGEQCLTEWARPLIKENAIEKLVDPCLMHFYSEKEVDAMLHCASLCLERDALSRPRISQVLRMLDGDILTR